MSKKTAILAFSGGLDTSYCVQKLQEEGYDVITYYVHSGASDPHAEKVIEMRSRELGTVSHHMIDAGQMLWDEIVIPFLASGARRQGRYPILCADRYLIARHAVKLADELGADVIAHGCTGMGNDQVRFDVSFAALSDRPILAPIRDIQDKDNVRDYEIAYLKERGFSVPERASRFSINENLLGVTMSGGPIDRWETPEADARVMTAPSGEWPSAQKTMAIGFEKGRPFALDGKKIAGADMLQNLNAQLGKYGIGYDIYTGDTLVGLKGRIVFEAPGLTALETAHAALFEATASAAQNAHRRKVGEQWVDLVYDGRFFDPLRNDLEAYLTSAQARATGTVTLNVSGGQLQAVAVDSPYILKRVDAVYAQKAAWSGAAAEGFTQLSGQSTVLWNRLSRGK